MVVPSTPETHFAFAEEKCNRTSAHNRKPAKLTVKRFHPIAGDGPHRDDPQSRKCDCRKSLYVCEMGKVRIRKDASRAKAEELMLQDGFCGSSSGAPSWTGSTPAAEEEDEMASCARTGEIAIGRKDRAKARGQEDFRMDVQKTAQRGPLLEWGECTSSTSDSHSRMTCESEGNLKRRTGCANGPGTRGTGLAGRRTRSIDSGTKTASQRRDAA